MANRKQQLSKLIKTLAQVVVTVLALYLVLTKIDLTELSEIIRKANPWYLLLSFLFFNISKIINALRLNRFFRDIGIELSTMYNMKLYYLGMFYNLFLPGGVGGDGYKIYILQKNHGIRMINVFNAVFWDRLCGIVALAVLSLGLLLPSTFAEKLPQFIPYAWAIIAALYPLSFLLNKLFYKQFLGSFIITAWESMLIQVTQVISAFFILKAISPAYHAIDYLAIFLISSIATVLPVTVGGAGAREITFYYLLDYLSLDTSTGVALSLIFFGISAVSALAGILGRTRHEKSISQKRTEG
ncbi:MAG: flippase-like domain-containing protein [Chlorobium sp.]|uniref:lysylphosphatidylglycerol synthase transmembrane domain-containing protein n=1 Tax=Chlorobium sp. TaxID=1095 RepID=UPI0025BBEF89|nr:lysylphosphatidylglycerol synthase transmembrane domain-containing protein [Chlorobium sp.]MCF8215915.1 flippase-like domain-containing protein [Chlorobium sp.]MCF8270813.1 flippase-like domain-containing protein [Chlorobium sp.]MCF8287125.1 flippase-like domain-containing protein [Chlorobium sp.]MCF8290782.1 flippase-like domain-containing protein [Chlorobium sp.]MCF8384886.1 flippase-like domain-containing protein [Chlorobium sp.]